MPRLFRILFVFLLGMPLAAVGNNGAKNPVAALVDRIQPGQSARFVFELAEQQSPTDFFELGSRGGKILIRGNNNISIAAGLNWYLKYHAGVQITWNNPRPRLSNVKFPRPKQRERYSTEMLVRYYMNYCTFSYSTAFWDWERWEREIDWMALHGVTLPLSLTGTATVWRNTLLELGVDRARIDSFVAGPAHQAWWMMNNLEAWGGPNPEAWYEKSAALERRIVERCREWGMEPVFAGYGGMVPNDTVVWRQLGLTEVQEPGLWCGYKRPAFLLPTDPAFPKIADVYYKNLKALYGEEAKYFAIDPFHEGGSTAGVDLSASGAAIYGAMKRANPGAVWVAQGWQACPHPEMIRDLPGGDLLVLDLFSESRPMWGDRRSPWRREGGYGRHDWVYCMLLNFGGNVGMHGKMQRVIDGYYLAREMQRADSACARFLKGVGTTPEGIENNPVMFELLYELPWRAERFDRMKWVEDFVLARYGHTLPQAVEAWRILANTVYDAPYDGWQEGTTESVFCARPALRVDRVSSWGSSVLNYDASETERALGLLVEVAERFRGCNNFEYDIVDVARQALADRGNVLLKRIETAFDKQDRDAFRRLSDDFLRLILFQDSLLNSRAEFMVGPWIEAAMRWGGRRPDEQAFYRWNARTLPTTWGNRHAADVGGLHDYAHREWAGMLRDFYYPRWKTFFDALNRGDAPPADYYPMEAAWAEDDRPYPIHAETNPIDMAWKVYNTLIKTR